MIGRQHTLARDYLTETGFSARARRCLPFTAWLRGLNVCIPGFILPGAFATGSHMRGFGRVGFPLPDEALQALDRLVMLISDDEPMHEDNPTGTPSTHGTQESMDIGMGAVDIPMAQAQQE